MEGSRRWRGHGTATSPVPTREGVAEGFPVLGRVLTGASPQESCASLRHYLVSTLGPYVANVTAAARECSYGQCHGHGRCVRRQPHDLGSLLHLGPGAGLPAAFRCHCYRGWAGKDCAWRVQPSPATACLAHGLYSHNDLPPPDTCLPRGMWGR